MENGLILRKSPGILQANGQTRVIQFWYEETLQIAPEGVESHDVAIVINYGFVVVAAGVIVTFPDATSPVMVQLDPLV